MTTSTDARLSRLDDHYGLTATPLLTRAFVQRLIDAIQETTANGVDLTEFEGIPMTTIDKWVETALERERRK